MQLLINLFPTISNSKKSRDFARSLSSLYGQNSMSHFLFLAANALPQSRLSLILLRKNTSFKQDLHRRSWLELVFLRAMIREKRDWVRHSQPKTKSVTWNSGQRERTKTSQNICFDWNLKQYRTGFLKILKASFGELPVIKNTQIQ